MRPAVVALAVIGMLMLAASAYRAFVTAEADPEIIIDRRPIDQIAMTRCTSAGGKATMSENNDFLGCEYWLAKRGP